MSHNVNGTGRRYSLFPGPGPVDMQSLLAPLEVPIHQSNGDSMHRLSFPLQPGYQPTENGGALPAHFGEANVSSSSILQNSVSHALDLFDPSSYADISDEEIAGLVTEIECGINGPPEDMYDNLDVAIRRMSYANSTHPVQAATKTTALRRLSLLLLNYFSAQNCAASAGDCGSALGTSAANNSESSAPFSSEILLGQCPGRRNSEIECGINGPPENMYDNLDVAICSFPLQPGYQPTENGGALPAHFGEANVRSSSILQNSVSHALDLFDPSSYADISDEEIAGLVTEIECGINGPPEDMYDNLDVAIRRMSCANSTHPVQAATKTTALRRLSLLLLKKISAQNCAASAGDCGSPLGTSAANNSESSAPFSSEILLGQCPGRRNSTSFIPNVEHRVGINNYVNACSALASFGSVSAHPDKRKRPRRSEASPFPDETLPSRKPKYTRRNSIVEAGASPFRSSESGRGSLSSVSRRTSISCALPRQANLGLHVQASGFPQAESWLDETGTNDEAGLIPTMNPVKQQLCMLSAPNEHSIGSNVHPRNPTTAMHNPHNALAMQQQDPRHDQHTIVSANSLSNSMKESRRSQKMIEDWDRKMGLRRAHSQTVQNSTRSRKMLQELMKRLDETSGL